MGWDIHGINGWAIMDQIGGSNGWGSYGNVSYCF